MTVYHRLENRSLIHNHNRKCYSALSTAVYRQCIPNWVRVVTTTAALVGIIDSK